MHAEDLKVLSLMITWAEAELDFRGLGPPPVPSRMSLVLVDWPSVRYGSENAPSNAAVPARNARRFQGGMRHYAEKQERKQTQKGFCEGRNRMNSMMSCFHSFHMPGKPRCRKVTEPTSKDHSNKSSRTLWNRVCPSAIDRTRQSKECMPENRLIQ